MSNPRESSRPQVGDVLEGKYVVESVLGEGGMGVVLRANHKVLGEPVAIKVLHPASVEHPEVVERFFREARIAAKLRSPHVARTIDVGTLQNGAPFIVMEYLEGEDLSERISRDTLPISTSVDFVLQAMEALAEAHSLGVIHRDLKPANLFLERHRNGRQSVKILDFGISKIQEADELQLTRTSTMMGSPLYMSPEQMMNAKDVDVRADIWALGVILYKCLTGKTPFDAESITELAIAVSQHAPRPLRADFPEVPEGLEKVILQCLAKSREGRPESVTELARLLAPFGSSEARAKAHTWAAGSPQVAALRPDRIQEAAPIAAEPASRAGKDLDEAGTFSPAGQTLIPLVPKTAVSSYLWTGLGLGVAAAVAIWLLVGTTPATDHAVIEGQEESKTVGTEMEMVVPPPASKNEIEKNAADLRVEADSKLDGDSDSKLDDDSDSIHETPPPAPRVLPPSPRPRPAPASPPKQEDNPYKTL